MKENEIHVAITGSTGIAAVNIGGKTIHSWSGIGIETEFSPYLLTKIRNGKKASIIAKMNSLADQGIIEKLYEASSAGVKIKLIVRGICCLKPGIPEVSDNIQVFSLIGRFLEHTRIFIFHNSGDTKILLSSADWMTRNLNRRVEVLFPVENSQCKKEILYIIDTTLNDSVNLRQLNNDGTYKDINSKPSINAHEMLYKYSKKKNNI